MEKFFNLKDHNTTVRVEIMAGITTFFAMAYIIFVNPSMLAAPAGIVGNQVLADQIKNAVFFATCISAFVGTFLMAVLAKIPFAQAPGMGLNAFFAYTVMLTMGYTYQEALAIVFISGLLFILITVLGLREAIVKAIPKNIRTAISGGIGLFIAFIGLKNAGLVVNNDSTFVGLIDFTAIYKGDAAAQAAVWGAILAVLGVIIIAVLYHLKIKGSVLIGIAAVTLLGLIPGIGVTTIPDTSNLIGNFGTQFNDFVNVGLFGFVDGFKGLFGGSNFVNSAVTLVVIVISFSLVDMFDTIGTLLGTAGKANLLDDEGNMPRMKQALLCDAIATTTGAMLGTSTVTTYVESSAGIGEGGKTGLTSLVTSVLFLLAIPFAPIIGIVPAQATAPALIFVGALMLSGLKNLEFDDLSELFPAFLTIVMMPLSYSIANGIAFGLISYSLIKICTGKIKEVKILTVIFAVLFIARFFVMAM